LKNPQSAIPNPQLKNPQSAIRNPQSARALIRIFYVGRIGISWRESPGRGVSPIAGVPSLCTASAPAASPRRPTRASS
jgi:hypothetical protein